MLTLKDSLSWDVLWLWKLLYRHLREWLADMLAKLPEHEEHISRDSLRYWLRRDRQQNLDRKGLSQES